MAHAPRSTFVFSTAVSTSSWQAFSHTGDISPPYCNVVSPFSCGSRLKVTQRFGAQDQFPRGKVFWLSICVLHMTNRMWNSLLLTVHCSEKSRGVHWLTQGTEHRLCFLVFVSLCPLMHRKQSQPGFMLDRKGVLYFIFCSWWFRKGIWTSGARCGCVSQTKLQVIPSQLYHTSVIMSSRLPLSWGASLLTYLCVQRLYQNTN